MSTQIERHKDKIRHKKRVIQSYRAKADAKRTLTDKFADFLTSKFGTVVFLLVNLFWFFVWIIINTNVLPGVEPFDPFPFGLLTMVVSLEAIFLAIVVLVSQNRAAKITEIREEIDLQINTISEGEVNKMVSMMALLLKKNGINIQDDPELAEMMRPLKNNELEKIIEDQVS